MTMGGLEAAATSVASTIGRYFNVINTVPSLFLVVLFFVLLNSGAWSGPPDFARSWEALSALGIGGTLLLVLATLALSLVLHPLQFTLVQLFEGYWGLNEFARNASRLRILYHRSRLEKLKDESMRAGSALLAGAEDGSGIYWKNVANEADRLIGRYPDDEGEIMPTRLGNMLRRYERSAGAVYNLDAITVIPLIALVAPADQVEYFEDQATKVELAVRTVVTALIASAMSVAFLWWHGWWLMIALVFYGAAYLAYRGAVISAESFGQTLGVLIDLNRFELYRRLRLPLPKTANDERRDNPRLIASLRGKKYQFDYEDPKIVTDTDPSGNSDTGDQAEMRGVDPRE